MEPLLRHAGADHGPAIIDGTVAMRLRAYDAHAVLWAYQRAIDVLDDRLADGRSTVLLPHNDAKVATWLHGRKECLDHWIRQFRHRIACDIGVVHSISKYNVIAKLLGTRHLVYDPVARTLLTESGTAPHHLDPVPTIEIIAGPSFRFGMPQTHAETVARIIRRELRIFDFDIGVAPTELRPHTVIPRFAVEIRFTHPRFVLGERWGLVRCLDPKGNPAHNRPRSS